MCYALYLSHVCPLEYDLLFERFLDLNRKEAPDIDIDFCKDRRGEIIRYVKEKYGEANVAQIGTFGTLAAKAAITRRRPRARLADAARRTARWRWCPSSSASRSTKRSKQSDELKQAYDTDPRSSRAARPGHARSRAWPATSARTPRRS